MGNQTSALRPLDHLLVVPVPKMTYLSNAPLRFATSVTKSALYRINDFINCVNRLKVKNYLVVIWQNGKIYSSRSNNSIMV